MSRSAAMIGWAHCQVPLASPVSDENRVRDNRAGEFDIRDKVEVRHAKWPPRLHPKRTADGVMRRGKQLQQAPSDGGVLLADALVCLSRSGPNSYGGKHQFSGSTGESSNSRHAM
ncbi:unnamed protein product [Lota lota]